MNDLPALSCLTGSGTIYLTAAFGNSSLLPWPHWYLAWEIPTAA